MRFLGMILFPLVVLVDERIITFSLLGRFYRIVEFNFQIKEKYKKLSSFEPDILYTNVGVVASDISHEIILTYDFQMKRLNCYITANIQSFKIKMLAQYTFCKSKIYFKDCFTPAIFLYIQGVT